MAATIGSEEFDPDELQSIADVLEPDFVDIKEVAEDQCIETGKVDIEIKPESVDKEIKKENVDEELDKSCKVSDNKIKLCIKRELSDPDEVGESENNSETGEDGHEENYTACVDVQIKVEDDASTSCNDVDELRCIPCDQVFDSHSKFNRHYKIHHPGEKPWSCPTCCKAFITKQVLDTHLLVHMEKNYTCRYCPKKFTQKGHAQSHEKTHTKEVEFFCRFCGKGFVWQNLKTKHEKTHIDPAKMFNCSQCDQNFYTQERLDNHERAKHPLFVLEDFTCHMCNKSFSEKGGLNRHIRDVHNGGDQIESEEVREGDPSYDCVFCSKKFNTRGQRTWHERESHPEVLQCICPFCSRQFTQKGHLDTHVKRAHKPAEHEQSKWKCEQFNVKTNAVCTKSFFKKCDLQRHMQTHETGKNLECELCAKPLKNSRALKNHYDNAHGITLSNSQLSKALGESMNFCCNSCKKFFESEEDLQQHVEVHHSSSAKSATVMKTSKPKKDRRKTTHQIRNMDPLSEVMDF